MRICELGGGSNALYFGKEQPNGDFYLNVDARSVPKVDLVCDFDKPLPLENEDFHHIFSKFAAEHVSWRSIKAFIAEVYRILKPGGTILFIMPNLRRQCEIMASEKNWTLQNNVCMMFGDLDYPDNSHKGSLSEEMAKQFFEEAAFKDVVCYQYPFWPGDMVLEAKK